MMSNIEYRQELQLKYNGLVYQIAKKNVTGEDYSELLEAAKSIANQLLVLDIEYNYEVIKSEENKKNNMR